MLGELQCHGLGFQGKGQIVQNFNTYPLIESSFHSYQNGAYADEKKSSTQHSDNSQKKFTQISKTLLKMF